MNSLRKFRSWIPCLRKNGQKWDQKGRSWHFKWARCVKAVSVEKFFIEFSPTLRSTYRRNHSRCRAPALQRHSCRKIERKSRLNCLELTHNLHFVPWLRLPFFPAKSFMEFAALCGHGCVHMACPAFSDSLGAARCLFCGSHLWFWSLEKLFACEYLEGLLQHESFLQCQQERAPWCKSDFDLGHEGRVLPELLMISGPVEELRSLISGNELKSHPHPPRKHSLNWEPRLWDKTRLYHCLRSKKHTSSFCRFRTKTFVLWPSTRWLLLLCRRMGVMTSSGARQWTVSHTSQGVTLRSRSWMWMWCLKNCTAFASTTLLTRVEVHKCVWCLWNEHCFPSLCARMVGTKTLTLEAQCNPACTDHNSPQLKGFSRWCRLQLFLTSSVNFLTLTAGLFSHWEHRQRQLHRLQKWRWRQLFVHRFSICIFMTPSVLLLMAWKNGLDHSWLQLHSCGYQCRYQLKMEVRSDTQLGDTKIEQTHKAECGTNCPELFIKKNEMQFFLTEYLQLVYCLWTGLNGVFAAAFCELNCMYWTECACFVFNSPEAECSETVSPKDSLRSNFFAMQNYFWNTQRVFLFLGATLPLCECWAALCFCWHFHQETSWFHRPET